MSCKSGGDKIMAQKDRILSLAELQEQVNPNAGAPVAQRKNQAHQDGNPKTNMNTINNKEAVQYHT